MDAEKTKELAEHWVKKVFDSLASHQRDWVGIYWKESFIDPSQPNSTDLIVGPYIGPETPHVRIPVDQGLCGMAVREEKTINEKDVRANTEFLACSTTTRSEVVIPIRNRQGTIVGELDIDSNSVDAFDPKTQAMLEKLCEEFGHSL
jgi:putative methionine-R-sulfoxide reductase with GAF domain